MKEDKVNIPEWERQQHSESFPNIVLNRIRTPDGTVLTSYHRHDYKEYRDANGHLYAVDGGTSYLRRIDAPGYVELSVDDSAPFEVIRESLHWGSLVGNDPTQHVYKPICELSNAHIKNILNDGYGSQWVRNFLKMELAFRKKHKIVIKDKKHT